MNINNKTSTICLFTAKKLEVDMKQDKYPNVRTEIMGETTGLRRLW